VLRTFAIITTNPNADMAELRERMPVILDQAVPSSLVRSTASMFRFWNGCEAADLADHPKRQRPKTRTPDYLPRSIFVAVSIHPARPSAPPCCSSSGLHIGGDLRHRLVRVVNALAAVEA